MPDSTPAVRLRWLALAVFGALLGAAPLAARPPPIPLPRKAEGEVRRTVIALHNTPASEPYPEFHSLLSRFVEAPLNYLGVVVKSHRVSDGPPPAAWTQGARAVVTWFQYGDPVPKWVMPWLARNVPSKIPRVVHLDSLQPLKTSDEDGFAAWLRRLGLVWDPGYLLGPVRVDVRIRVDEALATYEGNPIRRATREGPRSVEASHNVWIETRSRTNQDLPSCTPVLTAPWGGLALQPWLAHISGRADERRLFLQPFAFLREALGLERIPAPQPAVRNGRRLFFLHVDGDGFETVSWIDPTQRCGELFRKEIVERFQIPCTLSIIVASLTDRLRPEKPTKLMDIAKDLFALPYVEIASHGVIHPFDWRAEFGDDPDLRKKFAFPGLKGFTYTQVNEVRDSIEFIRRYLTPPGKDCVGMLWTGDCLPPPEAIREAARQGCWNLNGGTFRWDPSYDSASFVSPWARIVDGAVQVCAGAANDNEYPGFYDTNPTAFGGVDATIERTGTPRILKPANVYAHFYSVERKPRMEALQALLQRWAVEEPTLPVHASVYARGVAAALRARIIKTDRGWQLRNFGACRTVRLDDEPRDVDLEASRGVHGTRREGTVLHVHMSGPEADLVLSSDAPRRPHVEEANCLFEDVKLTERGVQAIVQAYVPRLIVLAGFEPGGHVEVVVDGTVEPRRVDTEGRVRLLLPRGGPNRLEVRAP